MQTPCFDLHVDRLLPEGIFSVQAKGTQILCSDDNVYLNYFNDSIRWLCGYNNSAVNQFINTGIAKVRADNNEIFNIEARVRSALKTFGGKAYAQTFFTPKNVYHTLADTLLDDKRPFFITFAQNVFIPPSRSQQFLSFAKLIAAEAEPRQKACTPEGLNIRRVENVFRRYKNRVAGFILSPLLIESGGFLSEQTCALLVKLLKKYRIPLIWDESLTSFYRSGTFYLFEQYPAEPDIVVVNANLSQKHNTHFFILKKRLFKKQFKHLQSVLPVHIGADLIILNAVLLALSTTALTVQARRSANRLIKKLTALQGNTHGRFRLHAKGLIVFLDVRQEQLERRLEHFLTHHYLLVASNQREALLMLPQLALTEEAIDIFVHTLDNFFRNGLRLPMHH